MSNQNLTLKAKCLYTLSWWIYTGLSSNHSKVHVFRGRTSYLVLSCHKESAAGISLVFTKCPSSCVSYLWLAFRLRVIFRHFLFCRLAGILTAIQEGPESIPGWVRNFNSYFKSGTSSIPQPREDNWVAAWYEKSRNPVKKTEIKIERIVLR